MENSKKGKTRREFLKIAGVGGLGAASLYFIGCPEAAGTATVTKTVEVPKGLPAASTGYLVWDLEKCASCQSCMLACSLAHEGKENLSFARTQRPYDSFGRFPDDIQEQFCRQCVDPACVTICPSGAFHVDADNGNIRTIDEAKCDAYQKSDGPCQLCLDACPYVPTRVMWNHEKSVAQVCDLCADAPYFSETGGPNGKQACVEVCPLRCIKLVNEVPDQRDEVGYNVNLRTANWLDKIVTPDKYEPDARMKQRQMA